MSEVEGQEWDGIRAIRWVDQGLELLDQRRLPRQEHWLRLEEVAAVGQAITDMVVRGAPAIGVTAAYGAVLAARRRWQRSPGDWRRGFARDLAALARARPTAVNLAWAVERMQRVARRVADGVDPSPALEAEAGAIHRQDIAANRRMGDLGAGLIVPGSGVLTHCNTGSLATGGYGTALGVIRSAWRQGRVTAVYADETRPWLQGLRLTAWELHRDGIPAQVLVDGAAAALMASGKVGWVVVGADRIAANGDVANKIGTYSLAVLARYHGLRFMVAAPISTIDPKIASGEAIPIETRAAAEVLSCADTRLGPEGADAWNPVFDVTPAGLIDAIVTERGVVEKPDWGGIEALLNA